MKNQSPRGTYTARVHHAQEWQKQDSNLGPSAASALNYHPSFAHSFLNKYLAGTYYGPGPGGGAGHTAMVTAVSWWSDTLSGDIVTIPPPVFTRHLSASITLGLPHCSSVGRPAERHTCAVPGLTRRLGCRPSALTVVPGWVGWRYRYGVGPGSEDFHCKAFRLLTHNTLEAGKSYSKNVSISPSPER